MGKRFPGDGILVAVIVDDVDGAGFNALAADGAFGVVDNGEAVFHRDGAFGALLHTARTSDAADFTDVLDGLPFVAIRAENVDLL